MDINQTIQNLDWKREPRGLYEPIAYTLASGGKRLRPTLALYANRIFGGSDEDVMPAALALEVFHNFTLVHDDVMDHSAVRRGRDTVHIRWNENTAILSGDQMMIEAYKLLSGVPADKLPKVLCMFNEMATGICEGQQWDMDFENRDDVSLTEYMEMIRLKTAVLLANALQTGAYIGGATEEEQEALYQYGILLGLAFQIRDDVLDVYGDEATFGKPIGGDIMEGKKTWVLLTAMQKADEKTRKELTELINSQMDRNEKIHAVMEIYNRFSLREAGLETIRNLTSEALKQLDAIPQNESTEQLRILADHMINRQS